MNVLLRALNVISILILISATVLMSLVGLAGMPVPIATCLLPGIPALAHAIAASIAIKNPGGEIRLGTAALGLGLSTSALLFWVLICIFIVEAKLRAVVIVSVGWHFLVLIAAPLFLFVVACADVARFGSALVEQRYYSPRDAKNPSRK